MITFTLAFTDVVKLGVLVALEALRGPVDETEAVGYRGVHSGDVWSVALHAPRGDANLESMKENCKISLLGCFRHETHFKVIMSQNDCQI